MSDNKNCNTCGPHLDSVRAELQALLAAPATAHATPNELVEMLMTRIAPHMHEAVEDAEAGALMLVPDQIV